MSLTFSDKPGARERHLQRRHHNPLFGNPSVSQAEIIRAQQQDAKEAAEFINRFRELVQQAASLESNAEADVVLKLKEQLDKAYEQCAGLAGEQDEVKDMLKRLLQMIMQAMWQGVGQDLQAHDKLQMEVQARESHFALLEHSLIADLLRPDSPIEEDELVPTLLSDSAQAVKLAMQLFMPEQQAALCQSAGALIAELPQDDPVVQQAQQRLADMEDMLQPLNQMPS